MEAGNRRNAVASLWLHFHRGTGRECPFCEVPVIRTQHKHGHSSAREVLLVSQFLIRGDEQIEAGSFRSCQQCPVLQPLPALIPRRDDRMAALDQQPQFLRNALVEDNFHPARNWSSGACVLMAAKSSTA